MFAHARLEQGVQLFYMAIREMIFFCHICIMYIFSKNFAKINNANTIWFGFAKSDESDADILGYLQSLL